ncbi:MAG: ankyrin repeat domain-containing protein [Bacteroidota bacterium]
MAKDIGIHLFEKEDLLLLLDILGTHFAFADQNEKNTNDVMHTSIAEAKHCIAQVLRTAHDRLLGCGTTSPLRQRIYDQLAKTAVSTSPSFAADRVQGAPVADQRQLTSPPFSGPILTPFLGTLHQQVETRLLQNPSSMLSQEWLRLALQAYYQQSDFREMPAVGDMPPIPIEHMQWRLRLHDATHTTPDLSFRCPEELFTHNGLATDDTHGDIRRVVLVGMAGTGKTALTCKLAYDWAQQGADSDFYLVYRLPAKALDLDQPVGFDYSHALHSAIAKTYFSDMPEIDRSLLYARIQASLNRPDTLLIIDGIDGYLTALPALCAGEPHKLLLTSRPHTALSRMYRLIDMAVDHLGIAVADRDALIRHNLRDLDPNSDKEVGSYIRDHHLEELVQVPLHLHLFCSAWKNSACTSENRRTPMRLSTLYHTLAHGLWDHWIATSRPSAQYLNRDTMFAGLEQLALAHCHPCFCPMQRSAVVSQVGTHTTSLLEACGVLFLDKLQDTYVFFPSGLHAYLTGRGLARCFAAGDTDTLSRVLGCCLYRADFKLALASLARALCSSMSSEPDPVDPMHQVSRIRGVLQCIDGLCHEVAGVQHLIIQLHLLNEWLLSWDVGAAELRTSLPSLEGHYMLRNRLSMWAKEAITSFNAHEVSEQGLLHTLLELFSEAHGVTAHYVNTLLEPLETYLWQPHSTHIDQAAVQIFTTLAGQSVTLPTCSSWFDRSLRHSCMFIRQGAIRLMTDLVVRGTFVKGAFSLLKNVLQDNEWRIRQLAVQALHACMKQGIDTAQVCPLLRNALQDNSAKVRQDAYRMVGTLLKRGQRIEEIISLYQDLTHDIPVDFCELAPHALPVLLAQGVSVETTLSYIQSALADGDSYPSALATLLTIVKPGANMDRIFSILKTALKGSQIDVRQTAKDTLKTFVERGVEMPKLLHLLKEALEDTTWSVRQAARETLRLLAKKEIYTEEIYTLLTAHRHNENDNCWVACGMLPTHVDKGYPTEQAWALLMAALQDSDEDIREATAEAMAELLASKKMDFRSACLLLQKAMQDSRYWVRRPAAKGLQAVVRQEFETSDLAFIFSLVQATSQDSDWGVRQYGLATLHTLVEQGACIERSFEIARAFLENTSYGEDIRQEAADILRLLLVQGAAIVPVFTLLKDALADSAHPMRTAAEAALQQLPIELLIDIYWLTQYEDLISFLLPKLYTVPLTITDTKDPNRRQLILYPPTGGTIIWEKLTSDIQSFKEALLEAFLPTINQTICEGYWGLLKHLYKTRIDLQTRDRLGNTLLHKAAQRNYVNVVKCLCKQVVDLRLTNLQGWTPLRIAVQERHLEIVAHLCERQAGLEVCDNDGVTPLNASAEEGHLEIVKCLCAWGANVETRDKRGVGPLKAASQEGHLSVVKLLCERGAHIDARDKEGATPLYGACVNGHIRVVKYLHEKGASLKIRNKYGVAPFQAAVEQGHVVILKYCCKHEHNPRKRKSAYTQKGSQAPR